MAAVIAAILAAFLAGAVALFREHRLQQRRLLVAARVAYDELGVARKGITISLVSNRWAALNALPGNASFSTTWETYKGDLAGHLSWSEWQQVEQAISEYLTVKMVSQDDPPEDYAGYSRQLEKLLGRGEVHCFPIALSVCPSGS